MNTVLLTLSALLCSAFPAALLAQTPAAAPPLPDAPSITAHLEAPAAPTGPTVLIDTTMGRLTCQLFNQQAPNTVASFVGLATGDKAWTDPVTQKKVTGQPFYDGTTFHRVIPGFMIQGGDRLGTGGGDAGFYLADEISPQLRFDVPGRLAMANSGPNTNGSQFFITEVPVPQLDGKYTIFGQCDAHSVLLTASIARVERNADDKPITPVIINKVTIVPAGQPVPPALGTAPQATPSGAAPGDPGSAAPVSPDTTPTGATPPGPPAS